DFLNQSKVKVLTFLNLSNGRSNRFWISNDGANCLNLIFDLRGKQLAFAETNSDGSNSIWHYRIGGNKATKLLENNLFTSKQKLCIDSIPLLYFTQDGSRILFFLRENQQNAKKN